MYVCIDKYQIDLKPVFVSALILGQQGILNKNLIVFDMVIDVIDVELFDLKLSDLIFWPVKNNSL